MMKALVMSGVMLSGCAPEITANVNPQEQLQIVTNKIGGHPFSHSYCIVCNPDLSPAEYGECLFQWAHPRAKLATKCHLSLCL